MQYIANQTQKMYRFMGKEFPCDPETIKQLNYALSLNRREERYVEVEVKEKDTKSKNP